MSVFISGHVHFKVLKLLQKIDFNLNTDQNYYSVH